ncbi:MAG: SpoIID/LytB domain-containing protein [Candidatus Latescibacterota bacterium]|nr:MAG: SpoIID/LytB domain-containing protein [Candidatus Latescibacterota bacterium]
MKTVVLGFCLSLLVCSCAAPERSRRYVGAREAAPDIRVLLDEGRDHLRISSRGGFSVMASNGISVLESSGGNILKVSASPPNLNLRLEQGGGVATADGEVRVVPKSNAALTVNRVSYAGEMRLLLKPNGKLMLLNVLPLEAYLEGVLPHEIGNLGPDGFDALKSQAIAARTYALGKIDTRSSEGFDVYSSVLDQVYKGLNGRNKSASAAVSDTRGLVLDRDGKWVKAYYCACCGGHTSDIREVWPDREPADYLHGIPDHDARRRQAFCRENKYFRWRYSFSGRQLGEILRSTIPSELGIPQDEVGVLEDISIGKRTRSGRVVSISIHTSKGDFTVTGDKIRWVLVTDLRKRRILPSVMFRLDKMMERDRIAFISIVGGGNGHGVGMCQNGAIAMSRKGYTYKMILEHYYPGCSVVRAY